MRIFLSACVHMYICVCFLCMYLCVCMYACIMYIYMYYVMCMYVYMYVLCMCNIHMCMYVCMLCYVMYVWGIVNMDLSEVHKQICKGWQLQKISKPDFLSLFFFVHLLKIVKLTEFPFISHLYYKWWRVKAYWWY